MMRVNERTVHKCNLCGDDGLTHKVEITKPDRFEEYVIATEKISYVPRRWLTCTRCDVAIQYIPLNMREGLGRIADNYYVVDFGSIDLRMRQKKILALAVVASDNAIRVERLMALIETYRPDWTQPESKLKSLDFGTGLGVFPIDFATARKKDRSDHASCGNR